MRIFICILIGYLLGVLNPAALISRLKHKDLRQSGTGNLGATNTLLVFGKGFGGFVMIFDIGKAFLAVWCARWIAPQIVWLPLAAGAMAVVGHCFPFYMRFKGGKGLACFAGTILAYDPALFAIIAVTGIILMLVVNYSFILPFYATVFFSAYAIIFEENIFIIVFTLLISALIVITHFGNFQKALRGEDRKIREYIKNKLFNSSSAE